MSIIDFEEWRMRDLIIDFEEWWKDYPKKVKKASAKAKWERLSLKQREMAMRDTRTRMSRDDRWQRGYVPDPTTYLNQERFFDEDLKQESRVPSHKDFIPEERGRASPEEARKHWKNIWALLGRGASNERSQ